MKKLSEIVNNEKDIVIPFGFENDNGKGPMFGDLVVISGDTNSGKTTLALNMAVNAASAGFPVLFVSTESFVQQIAKRILSIKNNPSIPLYIQDDLEGSYDEVNTNGIRIIFFDRYCFEIEYLRDCKELAIENNWCFVEVLRNKRRDINKDLNVNDLIIGEDVADVVYMVDRPYMYGKRFKYMPDLDPNDHIEICCVKGRLIGKYNLYCKVDWETGVIQKI